jgi:hypothetical protein
MEGVVIVGKLAIVLLFVGCGSGSGRTVARVAVPDDTFDCYLRVLAEMRYSRVDEADRNSGLIRAVKARDLPASRPPLATTVYAIEATIAIAPAGSGDGSDVSVTVRDGSLSEAGAFTARNTARFGGVAMTRSSTQRADLDTLSEACVS